MKPLIFFRYLINNLTMELRIVWIYLIHIKTLSSV